MNYPKTGSNQTPNLLYALTAGRPLYLIKMMTFWNLLNLIMQTRVSKLLSSAWKLKLNHQRNSPLLKIRSIMDESSPIKPSSVGPVRWLFIVAMILILFAPRLYGGQKHIKPVVEKSMASKQVSVFKSDLLPQIQPKSDPAMGKILDKSTGVKIAPSLQGEHPAGNRETSPLSVHAKKTEAFLHPIILKAATRYKIDSALIKAIIMVESGYNPKAVSKRGAKGLMQLMPKTAEFLGVKDSFNPEQNINAGVRHLKDLLNQFKGDVKLALAAYNAGSRKVRKYQGVPPFKSTRYYIKKVFEYHQYYRKKMAL
jgi:hypothetical protein